MGSSAVPHAGMVRARQRVGLFIETRGHSVRDAGKGQEKGAFR